MSRLKVFSVDPGTTAGVYLRDEYIGDVGMIASDSYITRWAFSPSVGIGGWVAYHGARKVKMRCKQDAIAALVFNHFADSVKVDEGGEL